MIKMKASIPNIFFLYVLSLYSFTTSAQNKTIDSLKKVLQTQKEDTNKVNTLNILSRSLEDVEDYINDMLYAKEALSLSERINYKKGKGTAYINIGRIYLNQNNYMQARENYFIALKIRKEIGDKKDIAETYLRIGRSYDGEDNYSEALKNYYSSLKLYEETGDKKSIAKGFLTIGSVYDNQGNYTESLIKFFAGLKIYEETNDKNLVAWSNLDLGNVYFDMGNYTEASKKDSFAFKIFDELNDKSGLSWFYLHIGKVYSKLGELAYAENDKILSKQEFLIAEQNLLSALKICSQKDINDSWGIVNCLINLGNVYTKLNNLSLAREYFEKCLKLAMNLHDKFETKDCYMGLSTIDSIQGNYSQALEHYKMYVAYRDSMYNQESERKSTMYKVQYESDKIEAIAKEQQDKKDALARAALEEEKLIRNAYAVGGILLLLLSGVLYNRYRLKQKSNKQLAEKNSIITIEKQRSEDLLHNILPEEVAEELKQKGSAAAKQFDEVTVMFTDFKGFTQISEKLTPSELVAEIDTCFKAFDNIITKHNIEKIKTIGDSYMCAGGLPVVNKTNATDVVNAAIEIRDFMLQRKSAINNPQFEIRIGVHTGPVVAGIVGVKKFAYDIWGDTVNIASRMESSGEAGKVNISGATYQLVRDKFNCTHRGKIQAKNKGEVDMYFVEGNSNL